MAGISAKGVRFVKGSGPPDADAGPDPACLRLRVASWVAAGSFATLTCVHFVARALGRPELSRLEASAVPLGIAGTLLALAVVVASRRIRRTWVPRFAYGLAFGGALLVSIMEAWRPLPRTSAGASLASLWIVMFPLFLPPSPRRTFICSLAAASAGPAVAIVLAALGRPVAPLTAASFFLPNLASAVVAGLVARALSRAAEQAQVLGSYRLVARIGGGGMGEVWRAEHRFLAQPAAAKIVRRDILSGPEREVVLKRFEIEARITAGLTSPHGVRLYDYGVTGDGAVYYVMELLVGMDLQRMVERHGAQEPARVVHFLVQACHVLAEAHAEGLIHRDIKPSNLIACRAGLERDFLKVLDFGLVKPVAKPALDLTRSGKVMGSPGYVAPEMALGKPIDCRADVYALGCVAYFLLTGREVFELVPPAAALRDHVYKQPEPPSQRAAQPIPSALDALVLACLAKDPDDRPDGAESLARKLRGTMAEAWTQEKARRWWADHD